ncbi:hypothetical protein F4781DRAFT_435531 [Annulohypoxylon bovei var. microspora]|nr:hypothetical protein F4781DRAFT_435531 [Annulohypoxylon bovei var. microspora]
MVFARNERIVLHKQRRPNETNGQLSLSSLTVCDSRPAKKEQRCFCPECGKALSNWNALARHRKTRHRIGRQWYCQQLDCKTRLKAYGRFDHFKWHLRSAHGIELPRSDPDVEKSPLPDCNLVATRPRLPPDPDHPTPTIGASQGSGLEDSQVRERSGAAYHKDQASILSTEQAPQLQRGANPTTKVGDLDSTGQSDLVRMLRSQILECERLREKCKVLTMERDEYAEALKLSEKMRTQHGDESEQALG